MAASPSPSIVEATVGELRAHAPFDQMDAAMLHRLASRLVLRYFAKGSSIVSPDDGVVRRLVIIQRGSVTGINCAGDAAANTQALSLVEGEMFPIGAIMSQRPTVLTFTATTDVFCYEMAQPVFEEVMDLSRPFRHFATRRLAHLLDQSRRNTQTHYSANLAAAQTLASPLKEIVRRSPVTVAPETPVHDVLALMKRERIGSVVILGEQAGNDSGQPMGIFTERDVLDRVALPQVDQSMPISALMTREPFSLPSHAPVFDAAKAMAERRFRHVLVTEEGRFIGVVSERDLFAMQRLSLGETAKAIERAGDVTALAGASADVRRMAGALVGQGVAAEQLTQFVTTMNDAIVGRALALAAQTSAPPDVAWCWMGLGSEGRMEQTLATDQDNAIIFSPPAGMADDANIDLIKAGLLAFAAVANQILDAVGFPLCRGDIMAKNPKWCLTETQWRDTFGEWMRAVNPSALLNAAIFFDFRALHGDVSLAGNLKSWLAATVTKQSMFIRHMAVNALQVKPPIGVLRDFVDADSEHPGTIDLKVYAARPFIDAARVFALANQVIATNTADRLRLAGEKMRMSDDEINAYVDAFHFVQLLRLRNQDVTDVAATETKPSPNRIRPDDLNELDRRILKEALRQARKLQSRLEMDFQL